MKKINSLKLTLLSITLVVLAPFSKATILTFDDISNLSGSTASIPDGYGGLNWGNMFYLNSAIRQPGSGYENGTVSGDYIAYNSFANVGSVSGTLFDFNGAYLTGAWNDGLNITVSGFLGGNQSFSRTVVVDHDAPTWFDFNFSGIDSLSFRSFGGIDVLGLNGSGRHFAMDNFTFNEPRTKVPDSASTMLLFSGAMFGLVALKRRRKV